MPAAPPATGGATWPHCTASYSATAGEMQRQSWPVDAGRLQLSCESFSNNCSSEDLVKLVGSDAELAWFLLLLLLLHFPPSSLRPRRSGPKLGAGAGARGRLRRLQGEVESCRRRRPRWRSQLLQIAKQYAGQGAVPISFPSQHLEHWQDQRAEAAPAAAAAMPWQHAAAIGS